MSDKKTNYQPKEQSDKSGNRIEKVENNDYNKHRDADQRDYSDKRSKDSNTKKETSGTGPRDTHE